jgi:hypothetical protein
MNDRSRFDQPDLESLLPAVPFSRRGFSYQAPRAASRSRRPR